MKKRVGPAGLEWPWTCLKIGRYDMDSWARTNYNSPPSAKSMISATTNDPLGSLLISTPRSSIKLTNAGLAACLTSSIRTVSSFFDVFPRSSSVEAREEMIAGVKCRSERGMIVYNNIRLPAALVSRLEGRDDVCGKGNNSANICLAVNLVSLQGIVRGANERAVPLHTR